MVVQARVVGPVAHRGSCQRRRRQPRIEVRLVGRRRDGRLAVEDGCCVPGGGLAQEMERAVHCSGEIERGYVERG